MPPNTIWKNFKIVLFFFLLFNFSLAQNETDEEIYDEDEEIYDDVEWKETISIEVKELDIHKVIALIRKKTGANIVVNPDLEAKITVSLKEVPWLKAVQIITTQAGYELTKIPDSIWKISTPPVVSIDFDQLEIKKALLFFAETSDLNIVFPENTEGAVSLTLQNIGRKEALKALLYSVNPDYTLYEKQRNIFQVSFNKIQEKRVWSSLDETMNLSKLSQTPHLTFDYRNKDLHDFLKELEKKSNFIFILAPEVSGKFYATCNDVPWPEMLQVVLQEVHCEIKKADPYYIEIVANPHITINFQNEEIHQVVQQLAEKAQKNILCHPSIQGKISGRFRKTPWKKALTAIIETLGPKARIIERDNFLFIVDSSQAKQMLEKKNQREKKFINNPLANFVFDINLEQKTPKELTLFLQEKTKFQFVIDSNISAKISISAQKIPFFKILEIIEKKYQLAFELHPKKVLQISKPPTISFSFKNKTFGELISLIATKAKVNILFPPSLLGEVSGSFHHLSWQDSLHNLIYLFNPKAKVVKKAKNLYKVILPKKE